MSAAMSCRGGQKRRASPLNPMTPQDGDDWRAFSASPMTPQGSYKGHSMTRMHERARLRSVMDMRRAVTGGTQCLATSAPAPFSTRQEPARATV